MNGVTKGHLKLMNKLVIYGRRYKAKPLLFLSHSYDRIRNPLKYEDKMKIVKSCAPRDLEIVTSKANNIFDVMKEVASLGANKLYIMTGSDRFQEFSRFKKYAGELELASIEVISAGERDPDADNVAGMSGTKLRNYAKNGDFDSFKKSAATKEELMTQFMYTKIREGFGIKD